MSATPLIIGPDDREKLQALRELASQSPVDMRGLDKRLKLPGIKAKHMRQMTAQTVELLFGWAVTFSIELGHPVGTCRHMSMSSPAPGRVPRQEAAWMVAEELGFVGSLELCTVWLEDLRGHGKAVNVVQPVTAAGETGRQ